MQESRPVRLTWQAICAAGLVLIVAYFLVPGDETKDVLYSVLGIAATATLLAAARRQPKQLRVGWYLVAAANSCFVVGDSLSTIVHMVTGHEASPPSVTDGLYFAAYPFLFAGVLRISNLRKLPTARETRADSALVSLGALTLAWHFLMQAYADDDQLSVVGKAVTLAYPVMDIGVLYLVIFGIFSGAARHTANQLVGAAMCLLVAADFAYSELAVHSTYNPDSLSNAGFLASYVLFAAGAAVPPRSAPRRIIVPAEVRHWLPLIGGAMLVPPCVLLLSAITGAEVNVAAIAAMSVVLTALAIVRTSWLFDRLRKQAALLTQRGESLHLAIGTQHALQEDLERQASHDSLTGLANRGLLRKGIVTALAHGAPAMLFCDLDGFKEVNDSLGHGVGDELLVVVARRLSAAVRESELVARLGGDEFAILLDRVDGPADAVALAHRVVALLQQPIMIGELRIQLTASVGVAFAGTGTSPETLLSDADAAMYEAKAAGRNRLAVFESQMRERVNHRRAVVNNFEGSLQRGEWLIEYQPQIRLSDGALEGFEALVRWAHPTLGVLTPDQFITLAEETGFIIELGRWILNQSCAQAVSWNAHRGLLSVAVNVSGRQLAESRLIQDVLAALASTGLRPEQLILEITESLLVHDPVGMAAALAAIRALGVRIAIDDFGTGYSSLSYLSRLPVDILKIDKSFVDTLMDPGGDSAAFIEIILRLARHLHLVATAEGIEHRQQYDVLKDLRCDSGQGFLLSRPLGRDAAVAFAEHYSPASTITTAR